MATPFPIFSYTSPYNPPASEYQQMRVNELLNILKGRPGSVTEEESKMLDALRKKYTDAQGNLKLPNDIISQIKLPADPFAAIHTGPANVPDARNKFVSWTSGKPQVVDPNAIPTVIRPTITKPTTVTWHDKTGAVTGQGTEFTGLTNQQPGSANQQTTIPDVFKAQTGASPLPGKASSGTLADAIANMFGQSSGNFQPSTTTATPQFPTYKPPGAFDASKWIRKFLEM